jgi:D-sedoheptulose 7-phosphate isomerase
MHICAELVGRFRRDRRALPAIALNADPAIVTALSNDYSYESVFSRQVEALAKPGDVVWGISTSGHSKNVVEALRSAHLLGASTIGLTGEGGGALAEYADVLLAVPLSATPRIQEIHVITYHVICDAVEAAVCRATLGGEERAGA